MVDKNTNSIIVKSHASDMSQIRILIGNIEEKNELIFFLNISNQNSNLTHIASMRFHNN